MKHSTCAVLAFGAALLSLAACSTPAVGAGAAAPTEVAIDAGKLSGVADASLGVVAFKGIPFAQPPLGDLRWRAPQPVAAWQGVRAADEYGHDCMQDPVPSDAAPLGTPPDEDCLYLNVWRPDTAAKKLPVLVWIYGGGFVNGGSSPPTYSGAYLAKQGVVVVSFNYRLGRFGFFAHPDLTRAKADNGLLGNYGYMDQIAALEWVKRNASAFGGDPGNVTLVGESAGGGSVHAMLTSPLARGLVHKAVVMSGGGRGALMGATMLQDAENAGLAFAASKSIAADEGAMGKLRALSAAEITSGLNMATMGRPGPKTFSTPMIDGKIIVEEAQTAYENDRFTRTPMMVGATSNDIGRGATGADKDKLFAQFGASEAEARATFDPDGALPLPELNRRVGLITGRMIEPARFIATLFEAKGLPAWHYRFSYVADSARTPHIRGAGHATDIPFFFDTVKVKYGDATTPKDEAMGHAMARYLANFAKTGDPNGAGLPVWPRYTPAGDTLMDFAEDGVARPQRDPWGPALDIARGYIESQH